MMSPERSKLYGYTRVTGLGLYESLALGIVGRVDFPAILILKNDRLMSVRMTPAVGRLAPGD